MPPRQFGALDQMRARFGAGFSRAFHNLAQHNPNMAAAYLSDERLHFPTFFLLIPEIEELQLYDVLPPRATAALEICAYAQMEKNINTPQLDKSNPDMHAAVQWMLFTGASEDGLFDEYDAALDAAAAMLLLYYQDKTALPIVAELIFRRNRRGAFIHDLAWAFFQMQNVHGLRLVAQYLRSSNPEDVALASKLLHTEATDNYSGGHTRGDNRAYANYMAWLENNQPFLYYTGESFQQKSDPTPFEIDEDAQYVSKGISPVDKKPLSPMTENEVNHLKDFHKRTPNERKLLASYSQKLLHYDKKLWSEWMNKSVQQQLLDANAEGEGGAQ